MCSLSLRSQVALAAFFPQLSPVESHLIRMSWWMVCHGVCQQTLHMYMASLAIFIEPHVLWVVMERLTCAHSACAAKWPWLSRQVSCMYSATRAGAPDSLNQHAKGPMA